MNQLLKSAKIIHHPDTTISKCQGNVELFFSNSPQDLEGKKLSDFGLYFVYKNGNLVSEEQFPINIALKLGKAIRGTLLGIYNEKTMQLSWVKMDVLPEFSADGGLESLVTLYVDATEPTEKDIAQSLTTRIKDEWEKTFDAIPDVITILSPDLQIIRANKAAHSTFNIAEGQLGGKFCYDVFHDRQAPCPECPIWQPRPDDTYRTGVIYNSKVNKSFEVTSSPVLDDNGEVKFLVHTARDITQKLKNEALRMMLSAATEQTTESVVITNLGGNIEYVNPSYSVTSGFTRGELIGRNLRDISIMDESDSVFDQIWSNLEKGEVWKGRLTSKKKDGSQLILETTYSPIFNREGKIINYLGVKRDVTKEEHLQQQLQQAIKMEAIGTLAGGIAHDFNNILSAMIGYGQIAKGRLEKDDPLLSDIEQILTAGDRAANLVKQILTFSRRDTQENFIPIQLQYIIQEALKLLRSSIPTTIKIVQNIDNKCPPILADAGQIHQVLMNLCTNAKQAIGPNYGTITITLEKVEKEGPQILNESSLLTSGSYLHLKVEDNGNGMSEDLKSRIFDPFFTTKPLHHGTGLGLSVVLGIVKKHGGEITFESTLDVGTTFHLYFPVIDEEIPKETEDSEVEFTGSETVMIVDDEIVLARVMQRMLEKQGYKVALFTESLKAVSAYRQNPYEFDAVVTDMTMPNMTGAELAREFLSLRPELPIIMATGYSEIIDKEKATRIGITEFLYKPVKKKQLSEVVRKVLDHGKHTSDR